MFKLETVEAAGKVVGLALAIGALLAGLSRAASHLWTVVSLPARVSKLEDHVAMTAADQTRLSNVEGAVKELHDLVRETRETMASIKASLESVNIVQIARDLHDAADVVRTWKSQGLIPSAPLPLPFSDDDGR